MGAQVAAAAAAVAAAAAALWLSLLLSPLRKIKSVLSAGMLSHEGRGKSTMTSTREFRHWLWVVPLKCCFMD